MIPAPNVFPTYPEDTSVPLSLKQWVRATYYLLEKENLEKLSVFVEPGKWFYSFDVESLTFWQRLGWRVGLYEPNHLAGMYVSQRVDGVLTAHAIHFRAEATDAEMIDTIIHEIAHLITKNVTLQGSNWAHHGEPWATEYKRLRKKYISDKEVITDEYGHVCGIVEDAEEDIPEMK